VVAGPGQMPEASTSAMVSYAVTSCSGVVGKIAER
jgi:hypothetical protein